MQLSIYTVMMAMYSVFRDIKRNERLNSDESLDAIKQEEHGELVLELTKVYNELAEVYAELQTGVPEFPSIEELFDKIENSL